MSQENLNQNQQTPDKKNEIKQVVPVQPQLSAGLQDVLEMLVRREARQVAEDEEKKQRLILKQTQQGKNSQANEAEQRMIQMKCKHMKGGKLVNKDKKDYAVSMHVFIDVTRVIRCHICRMKWKEKDTKEFIYRDGNKYRNHTGIGWREAFTMLESSSNTQTASEAILTMAANHGSPTAAPTINAPFDIEQYTTPIKD